MPKMATSLNLSPSSSSEDLFYDAYCDNVICDSELLALSTSRVSAALLIIDNFETISISVPHRKRNFAGIEIIFRLKVSFFQHLWSLLALCDLRHLCSLICL